MDGGEDVPSQQVVSKFCPKWTGSVKVSWELSPRRKSTHHFLANNDVLTCSANNTFFAKLLFGISPHSDSKGWTLWSRVSSWLREPSSSLTPPTSIHRWVVFVQTIVKSKVHPSVGGVLLIGDHPGIDACLFCDLGGRWLWKLSSFVHQQMIKPKSQDALP